MKRIAIVWTSVTMDVPVRGVCIPYETGYELDVNGLPKGRWHYFTLTSLPTSQESVYTYALYHLSDDNIDLLKSERRLVVQVTGNTVNHDTTFSFNSDEHDIESMVMYKPFTATRDSKIGEFTSQEVANIFPWMVARNEVTF